ncbi:MAG TPA: cellulase family glycosylhydrolase [Candidatus Dormibacteraeota bacterium]|nr:cellulase family glycosylhydrolase [Candidatus Dormibacteraeota bacterium]
MLNGQPFRFDGLNVYDANTVSSTQKCGYTGATLGQNLTSIGSGQEVIRAWFFQPLATINGQRNWTAFDNTLAVARAHGVRVIFVLSNQWGYCDGGITRTLGWYQGGYKTQVDPGSLVPYRQWVSEVIARYAGNQTIAFWQLVNEGEARNPDASCSETLAAQALRGFADDVGGLIRAGDRNHLIGLGTIAGECGSNEGDYQTIHASAAIDICDYHDYGAATVAMPGDQYNGLQVSINRCHALGKPIVVAETGIHSTQVGGIAQRAALFDQKFSAQFGAGVDGELMWDWSMYAPSGGDYEIGPGDPALALLTRY